MSPTPRISSAFLKRIATVGTTALCAGLLIGCASLTGYPQSPGNTGAEISSLTKAYYTTDVVAHYESLSGDAARTSYRNEVVAGRSRVVDLNYYTFRRHLLAGDNLSEIGTDWAVLALSGAGTTVGAAGTKAILAAISGGITGARGSVEKNLYYQKTIMALVGQMEAMRKQAKLKIETGLAAPASRYPLSEALGDVDDYYEAGSIPAAVNGVSENSGRIVSETRQQISEIRAKRINPTDVTGSRGELRQSTATDKEIRQYIVNRTSKVVDGKVTQTITARQAADILKAYDGRVVVESEAIGSFAALRATAHGDSLKKLQRAVVDVISTTAADPANND